MDASIQKALHDKIYDKRKGGALELERLIRELILRNDHDRIAKAVDQLCHDYAYAIHQPYARNGGLIGLAATAIALGAQEVARYLEEIVPPVLSCFTDQDARVRYYACESMYNIAKTSKGEILPYFNEIFDALARLTADSELSVKNGAELLDRLMKDIITESATSYVSVVHGPVPEESIDDPEAGENGANARYPNAFSLPRFIPLLRERILVLNPFTRMFLVSWITLLDSIPDLELVSYLPAFLGGLFKFLNDTNQDVVTATQHALERFLDEVRHVASVKRELAGKVKSASEEALVKSPPLESDKAEQASYFELGTAEKDSHSGTDEPPTDADEAALEDMAKDSTSSEDDQKTLGQQDWMPGQDVHVDHPKILEILVSVLHEAKGNVGSAVHFATTTDLKPEEHMQLTALRWIDGFFEICPDDMVAFVPKLLDEVLPALSSNVAQVRQAGNRVNNSLLDYMLLITSEEDTTGSVASSSIAPSQSKDSSAPDRVKSQEQNLNQLNTHSPPEHAVADESTGSNAFRLDYDASVEALTRQFLNNSEATRVAALSWLIKLQQRAPKKVVVAHGGTFPALLKTLADTSDTVVTRDLQLLCQISKGSDDAYFTFFMVNLLKLFCDDRKLLETRGNLVIRQLCINLSPERIYRTMADCLEKEDDLEFASIMVQNLNNNLITAPELADLRRKFRNWDSKDSQTLFATLFRAWCHNAVATISLCLLAQAYEQAYNLVQFFAEIEMTVNMLIQIDKLVQLLESPVFTYLRLQLLEPASYPHLYKCLYGILMLLPQSAAFAALKNRLNSVSAIGFLHVPGVTAPAAARAGSAPASAGTVGRLKNKDDGVVKWGDLLEKFRVTQERARRARAGQGAVDERSNLRNAGSSKSGSHLAAPAPGDGSLRRLQTSPGPGTGLGMEDSSRASVVASGAAASAQASKEHKSRFGSGHLGKLASGVRGKPKSKPTTSTTTGES